ncbi:hypothetical protein ABK040_001713 [Willaertia magna]
MSTQPSIVAGNINNNNSVTTTTNNNNNNNTNDMNNNNKNLSSQQTLNPNAKPFNNNKNKSSFNNNNRREYKSGSSYQQYKNNKPSYHQNNNNPTTSINSNPSSSISNNSNNINNTSEHVSNNNYNNNNTSKPFKKPYKSSYNQQQGLNNTNNNNESFNNNNNNNNGYNNRKNGSGFYKKKVYSSIPQQQEQSSSLTNSNNNENTSVATSTTSTNTSSDNNNMNNKPNTFHKKPYRGNNNKYKDVNNNGSNNNIGNNDSTTTNNNNKFNGNNKFYKKRNDFNSKNAVPSSTINNNTTTSTDNTTTTTTVSNNNVENKSNQQQRSGKSTSFQKKHSHSHHHHHGHHHHNTNNNNNSPVNNKNKQQDEDEEDFWSYSYNRQQNLQQNNSAFSSKRRTNTTALQQQQVLTEEEINKLSLKDKLIYQLNHNLYECVICNDLIKNHESTWNCNDCYRIFHLDCIKLWVKQKLENEQLIYWKCPGCQTSLLKDIPLEYRCFCNKLENPKFEFELTPHSCGDICGKLRKKDNPKCPHICMERCHPGPCDECELEREEVCFCGGNVFKVKCADERFKANGISCGEVCEKLLDCKKHYCKDICHEGKCNDCKELINAICYCGKEQLNQVICSKFNGNEFIVEKLNHTTDNKNDNEEQDEEELIYRTYCCNNYCKKLLPCGEHYCDKLCHLGKCIKSKKSEWITNTMNPNEEEEGIDEYIKKFGCYQQCRKELQCGHFCKMKCHPKGKCMKCNEKIKVFCKCKRRSDTITCGGLVPYQEVFLECDNECKRIARIKQLADAFQLDYEKQEVPEFSEELIQFAQRNIHLIEQWELDFDTLLFSGDSSSSSGVTTKHFPPMKKDKRLVLHELAEHYKLTSVAVDLEPNRSVIVTKTNASRRPLILLSETIKDPQKLRKLKEKLAEEELKNSKNANNASTSIGSSYMNVPKKKSQAEMLRDFENLEEEELAAKKKEEEGPKEDEDGFTLVKSKSKNAFSLLMEDEEEIVEEKKNETAALNNSFEQPQFKEDVTEEEKEFTL